MNATRRLLRVGILWRADRDGDLTSVHPLFAPLARDLAERRIEAVPVRYADDDAITRVRRELLGLDAVLVWVDPISNGRNREQLDALLREVSANGVWVSAHPDVILKMGSKEVLYSTRTLGWGTDTHLYADAAALREEFPSSLSERGPRVLKQNRGNGGLGVFRIELATPGHALDPAARVYVQHALRGSSREVMKLDEFLRRCDGYFSGGGRLVDQPFLPRQAGGMVRCYVVQDRVAGFGHQHVTALTDPSPGDTAPPLPAPRVYFGPDEIEFQALKNRLESEWIPGMQSILEIERNALPLLWDADFLPRATGSPTQVDYALCEINASSVYPYPDEATIYLARALAQRFREDDDPSAR